MIGRDFIKKQSFYRPGRPDRPHLDVGRCWRWKYGLVGNSFDRNVCFIIGSYLDEWGRKIKDMSKYDWHFKIAFQPGYPLSQRGANNLLLGRNVEYEKQSFCLGMQWNQSRREGAKPRIKLAFFDNTCWYSFLKHKNCFHRLKPGRWQNSLWSWERVRELDQPTFTKSGIQLHSNSKYNAYFVKLQER